jgi:predicted flap endonuclease-1-like 5' DNA nuclease
MDAPNVIEVALLFIVVFLAGCFVGYFLRRLSTPADQPANAVPPADGGAKGDEVSTGAGKKPALGVKMARKGSDDGAAATGETSDPPRSPPSPKVTSAISGAAAGAASAVGAETIATMASDPESTGASVPGPKSPPDDKGSPPAETTANAGASAPHDDLKKIKGIGPKIEATLKAMGITSFDEIANWDRARIDEIDGQLKFKGRIDREEWVAQASALASAARQASAKDDEAPG